MAVQRSMEELNARIQTQHQGAVHRHPSGRGVAVPQGGARRPRAAPGDRRRAPRWSRSSSSERLSALRALGHPRLVHAAGRGPSRPTCSPSCAWPARWWSSAHERAPAARARQLALPDRPARRADRATTWQLGDEIGRHRASCGPRSRACWTIWPRFGDRRPRRGSTPTAPRSTPSSAPSTASAGSSRTASRGIERDASRPTSSWRSRRRRRSSRTTSRSRRPTASTTRSTSAARCVEDGRFDPLYLKNLRLWQLMVACGIAVRAPIAFREPAAAAETTHLILVQHAPLSIRFRFDEKRFDVDGAYDIRYEIVKKRIDKAVIRGTTERVTQPGKIAIVYGQPGGRGVPRLPRVPAAPGLHRRRGRGAGAGRAPGRARPARAAGDGGPARAGRDPRVRCRSRSRRPLTAAPAAPVRDGCPLERRHRRNPPCGVVSCRSSRLSHAIEEGTVAAVRPRRDRASAARHGSAARPSPSVQSVSTNESIE